MDIVALTGKKESGKSTLGEYMRSQYPESIDIEFSDAIIDMANDLFNSVFTAKDAHTLLELIDYPELIYVAELANLAIDRGYLVQQPEKAFSLEADDFQRQHIRLMEYTQKLEANPRLLDDYPISRQNKEKHREILQWLGTIGNKYFYPEFWGNLALESIPDSLDGIVTISGARTPGDEDIFRTNTGGNLIRVNRDTGNFDDDHTEVSIDKLRPDVEVYNNGTLEQLSKLAIRLTEDLPSPEQIYTASTF